MTITGISGKRAAVAFAVIVGLCTGIHSARAEKDAEDSYGQAIFTPVYGKTLPPVGHVNFCARNQAECRPLGGAVRKLRLGGKTWRMLNEVNTYTNESIRPVTDQELYAVPELWTYPTKAGDCEDYVLQKKRYLEGLGIPGETMLITVVLDEKGLGHAVLTVRTDRGDFVLDNMRNDIRRWNNTGYTFIKRQSQSDPRQWVSLTTRGTPVSATTVAGK